MSLEPFCFEKGFSCDKLVVVMAPLNRVEPGQTRIWAVSSVGRAPHSHCGDRGFDSPTVHHELLVSLFSLR